MNVNADNLISGYTVENQHFYNMASQDENLAETVRSFPCLYQKNLPEFKDKKKKEQAWISVAETMGLENGRCHKTRQFFFQILEQNLLREMCKVMTFP